MADDDSDLQIGVTPIGQRDQDAPQPAETPAPRAELVNAPKPDDSSDDSHGATVSDLAQHTYDLAKRAEEDQEKARNTFKGMQEEIQRLYKQEGVNASTPQPQAQPYPEPPSAAELNAAEPSPIRRVLALGHMMMAIPGAIFGGNKYNRGGAISGLQQAIQEYNDAGSKDRIAQKIALYREQVNITHQQNEDIFNRYKDIMADKRADIHTKLEAITTLAGVYKDQATVDAAATDNWEHFTEYMGKTQKMLDDTVKNVYGTMDEFNKAFGNSNEDQLYRSWGAENYPELREGLFSEDRRTKGNAVRALEKKKSFYTWQKENWKWMHPSETAGEKEEELQGQKAPPDTPPDDMRKAIQEMHPDLLFGTPKPGEKQKEDRRSKSKEFGFDPRRPFDR